MKTYQIKISFADGDKAVINVTAENLEAAIEKIKNTSEFKVFAANKTVLSISHKIIPSDVVNPTDYILQPSEDKGFWVVTDKKNNVVVKFKEGSFNETQKATFLFNTNKTAVELATIMRKIGEWLSSNHSDLI